MLTKTKISIVAASVVATFSIVGCGGNGSVDSTSSDITVERGPVLGATVKDASGNIATQVGNSNVYRFNTEATYPISAEGGFIDVDGDGVFNAGDAKFTEVLKTTKGGNITPLTTFVADTNETYVKETLGITDPYALPSKDKKVYVASEVIFDQMVKGVKVANINTESLESNITALSDDDNETASEFAKRKEKEHFTKLASEVDGFVPFVEGGFELTIAHVNDIHSNIDSKSYGLTFGDVEVDVDIGGYARLATKVSELTEKNENTLILNAGDTFQGSLYYSLFKGEADAQMMNFIPWDAMTLGNHEFDDGDEHLGDYLASLDLNSSQVLSANIDATGSTYLEDKFSPYRIKTFENGEKVGIIGITVKGKTVSSSNPSEELTFADEVETAQAKIDELKSQGINKIVLLTHAGIENDKDYASKLSDVDIIIGGDSHTLMGDFDDLGLSATETSYPLQTTDKNGKKVCIGHAWQYNYAMGQMSVVFDENGTVKKCFGDTKLLADDTFTIDDEEVNATVKASILNSIASNKNIEIVTENSEVKTKLTSYASQVDTKKAETLGTASERLGHNRIPGDNKDGGGALALGSDIAPIVAKSFYDLSNRADACIQNAGGVRVAIEEGSITMGDAYTLLPFANTLYEIEMTGTQIKQVLIDALNEALHGGDDGEVSTGAFPYAYGLKYDVYAQADQNSTIVNLEIKDRDSGEWSDINMTKFYVIVTNNYIAGGKDGYTTFKTVLDENASKGVDTYLDYAMSFVKYVQNNDTISKLPSSDHPIKSFHQSLKKLASYRDGNQTIEAGSEIVSFDKDSKRMFITNGSTKALDIVDITDPTTPSLVKSVDISTYGADLQSVNAKDGKVAIAVGSSDKVATKGKVVILDTNGTLISQTVVGYLPDMVTFNSDGTKVIVANEGEPDASDGTYVDVNGSIGVVTVANTDTDENANGYAEVTFDSIDFTNASDGTAVRLGGTPSSTTGVKSLDIEPEYITVDGTYAYVTLQENNAIAKVNISGTTPILELVKSLGAKRYDGTGDYNNTIDIEEEGKILMKNYSQLYGMYMPDSIASYQSNGSTYLVTANEGDGREYCSNSDPDCDDPVFIDEKKIKKLDLNSSIASEYNDENDLKVMVDMGYNETTEVYDKLYTYGARSFSIWDNNGTLVWDSGDQISKKVAELQSELFNQDEGEMDGRSGNKGAEPEALAVGTLANGKVYAFIGLERQNAIMVYDISTPTAPVFKDYINIEKDGDVSPEGMKFIPADESPNGKDMLLVGNEMSGTTVIYEVK
jgi:5'-nucleotidase